MNADASDTRALDHCQIVIPSEPTWRRIEESRPSDPSANPCAACLKSLPHGSNRAAILPLTHADAEGRASQRGLCSFADWLTSGSRPVAGPERRLGQPGAARVGLCNRACLNGRISGKDSLLMYVEKYPEKYAGKYRQRYPDSCTHLRRHVCLHLYPHLYLDLNPKLFAELNREKFEKSFQ